MLDNYSVAVTDWARRLAYWGLKFSITAIAGAVWLIGRSWGLVFGWGCKPARVATNRLTDHLVARLLARL